MIIRADISAKGNRIEIPWVYDQRFVERAKEVPGMSAVKKGKHGHSARFPLDTQTARLLRQAFGSSLRLSPELRAWGRKQMNREAFMTRLAASDSATLRRLPHVLPEVYERTAERPYQRADIKFQAEGNTLNGNQTGMGKTLELFATAFEMGVEKGPHLVAAVTTALVDTWATELEVWQPYPVLTGETVAERKAAVKQAARLARRGKPFWLVINFDMLRLHRRIPKGVKQLGPKDSFPVKPKYPVLMDIAWHLFAIDEAHKSGLSNEKSLFHRGAMQINARRKVAMTATPMGGKPEKLWTYLKWLEPDIYTNKWAWLERWFELDETEYGQTVTRVAPDKQEEFARSLQPHMLRRRRRDHRADLPEEEHIDVMCRMTPTQAKQYKAFEADAEIRIEEERLSATSILAEYTRLKQFANAACRVEKRLRYNAFENTHEDYLTLFQTEDSGKLRYLADRLDENGIRAEDPEPGARALVGSESTRMVSMVAGWLRKQGLTVDEIHGGVKGKDRTRIVREFRDDELQVVVVNTNAGGTSLNLEFINSVHILDETWNPDDQEQLWGRGDRGTREDALMVYWYRTEDTIQEDIHMVADGKRITNKNILDVRREMLGVRSR